MGAARGSLPPRPVAGRARHGVVGSASWVILPLTRRATILRCSAPICILAMPSVPWDDARCIFCLEEKPLTKAHLIPEFLGGNLFAYNECKGCNSELGSKIEAAIRKAPQIRF